MRCLRLLLGLCVGLGVSVCAQVGIRKDLPAWAPPDDALHVDPSQPEAANADGSLARPYASLGNIRWAKGMTVLLRRGTVLETPAFGLGAEDLTLGAYGEGERPVVRCTSEAVKGKNQHAIQAQNAKRLTLRDLDIHAPKATSCLRLWSGCEGTRVLNCRLRGAVWGIRAFWFSGLQVLDTEIHDTKDDGMFVQGVTDIEIGHCFIHDVNRNWKPPFTSEKQAGGDAIQFVNCDRWRVHHNVLDRSSSGNKFCFISNNPEQKQGVFEHNLTRGPLPTKEGGSALYFHDGEGLVVRYNTILGPAPSMLYSHSRGLTIYGNVCSGPAGGVFASKSAEIYHNTFIGQTGSVLSGGEITAANNIFVLAKGVDSAFGTVKTLHEDHNVQTHSDPGFVNLGKQDLRLRAGSPYVDAGRATSVTMDRDGTPIPTGKAPDAGAYERH